jgi:hypothetical protein
MANLVRLPFFRLSLLTALLLLSPLKLTARAGILEENLAGVWVMDVQKSVWGEMQKPESVVLEIIRNGNEIRYSGVVTYQNQDTRPFAFDGAMDGREYPVVRSYGSGKLVMNRKSSTTLESVYTSDTGVYVETARMVISLDGKHMTRYMSLRYPLGLRSWVEVYNRR